MWGSAPPGVCAVRRRASTLRQVLPGVWRGGRWKGDRAAKHRFPENLPPRHCAEKILASKAALEGERKQVTVLFADLKGSMELLADRDPEEARKILDPVLTLMMEAGMRPLVAHCHLGLGKLYRRTGQRQEARGTS